jgi:hypothetical protein
MAEVGFRKMLRRATLGGLLLLASLILLVAPASAHGGSHHGSHHGHAAVAGHTSPLAAKAVGPLAAEPATAPSATMSFGLAASSNGSTEPCGRPGHMPGHAGCCGSSHCPTAQGGLPVAAVPIVAPAASTIVSMSTTMAHGIASGPGERPPRLS